MIEELAHRLLRHIRFLQAELADCSRFSSATRERYLGDSDQRRNLERWSENLLNSLIDIAKISLTIEKLPVGDSYREIVGSISTVPEFSGIDARLLASWTRLRNVLAHEYLDVRWRSLEAFVREAPPVLEAFLEGAKRLLRRVSGSDR